MVFLWSKLNKLNLCQDESCNPKGRKYSYYNLREIQVCPSRVLPWHYNTPGVAYMWNSFTPYKFKFHAWLSLHGRCWIVDLWLRRGLPSLVLCPLCDAADETSDHLALQCPFARCIRGAFLGAPAWDSADSHLLDWCPNMVDHLSHADAKVTNSAIMLILRSLWLEWNARVFNDRDPCR
jgi:hypothetical protein